MGSGLRAKETDCKETEELKDRERKDKQRRTGYEEEAQHNIYSHYSHSFQALKERLGMKSNTELACFLLDG